MQGEVQIGWYDTGDIVTTGCGRVYHHPRTVKRFAKMAGEMIRWKALSNWHSSVLRRTNWHAVVTKPDAKRGEALVMFTTDSELIVHNCRQKRKRKGLPELAVPRDIRYIRQPPVLGSGKTGFCHTETTGITGAAGMTASALLLNKGMKAVLVSQFITAFGITRFCSPSLALWLSARTILSGASRCCRWCLY